jgi:hypothetical protein
MDLGILNTVIAMVVVLLVLSLLVQAVQMLLKKLLRLKSRQIEDSLKDLFDQAIASATPATQQTATTTTSAPVSAAAAGGILGKIRNFVRLLIVGRPDPASPAAEDFTNKVLDEFKKIGRVTKFGTPVLDSLSKEDLFKVMAKFESEKFFPDYAEKFKDVCTQLLKLRDGLKDIFANEALRGSASAKLAEIRAILGPIFNNVEAIVEGEQVKPKVLFADLLRLRQLDIGGVLNLLDEAQQAITEAKAVATQTGNNQELTQLETVAKALTEMAKLIGELGKSFDKAVSPLRSKLEQVEVWFDTVTQSFDERYTRHMRTVSIYISIGVVILLNANFFEIYKSLSTNEVQRNLIAQAGPEILAQSRQAQDQAPATPATTSTTPATTTTPPTSPNPTASPTPSIKEQVEESRQEIKALVDTYEGFGFSPVTAQQFQAFLWSTGGWTAVFEDSNKKRGWLGFRPAKNDKGVIVNADNEAIPPDCQEKDKNGNVIMKCSPKWLSQDGAEWLQSRKSDVVTLFGWTVMVLLLSVGAPFWQDTLESLFGIKNLLRQKSGTQNIEAKSGTGQPKE